ncbi:MULTISPECIES: ABC transporter ATP-binding protein [Pseudonocardia]|uniref:Iron(3+)-hydroxamate import ATP-binding protein FhuC n=2 Tax=Pseudonocardia TaxID=1847 RepID=A0A1Y2N3W5_PSEAH|nr:MULTISPECIES: ABC transporter ATP-binding protein [Pseudonocardia]OSY42162.1 Iron(3+)-hydroxamate import ATP-binding protein FhuC [Pseudonocardia autotrophica]TDN75070.1 iron complex transport system ATP-binding protein [Pseudonocardia autotrophica]BBF99014.1 ABC transporter ATPase [Pseudonocardia autotrophica]GEC23934.1 ABC transporter ATPase [Pseudonocardia saturnea]
MLSALDLAFDYDGTPVLHGVRLTAHHGRTVGLIGPNGSGKTTLLRALYGALAPRAGLVTLDDSPLDGIRAAERARRLAVVTQEHDPDTPLTVADMVILGRSPHRSMFAGYRAEDYRAAAAALTRVGARDLADRVFSSLSGGEKQRVLIARTLAQEADHLLLDEPTNHLDIRYQHSILSLVRRLDVTTVIVMHDLNLAARYCDSLVLLDDGRVVSSGPTAAVLEPSILEPVYGVSVRRIEDDDCVQLIFAPAADAELPPAPP